MTDRASQPAAGTRLSGRLLTLVRLAWLLVTGAGVGVCLVGVSVHYAQWVTLCSGIACGYGQLTPQQVQHLHQSGLSVQSWAVLMVLDWIFPQLASVLVGAIIFWRRPDDRMALIASFMLVAYGLASSIDFLGPSLPPTLQFLVLLYEAVGNISVGFFVVLFPNGRFTPRWLRWLLLIAIAKEIVGVFLPDSDVINALGYVLIVTAITVQIYRYRRVSNAFQRQQTKWVVFGIVGSFGGTLGMIVYFTFIYPAVNPAGSTPSILVVFVIASIHNLFLLLVPLSFGLAILRSHLWDIDVLIRRTVTYALLTALLLAVYFGGVILLQQVFVAVTGQRSEAAIILSTLAIAVLFVPLRSRIQNTIDRRFFRSKYDAQQALSTFALTARDETDPRQLSVRLMDAVDETLQPEQISLWINGSVLRREVEL